MEMTIIKQNYIHEEKGADKIWRMLAILQFRVFSNTSLTSVLDVFQTDAALLKT
jgi:hypothetical protein